MLVKKTIILSSLDNSSQKAVVNIEKHADTYKGQVRLYNFKTEPEGILSLGFLQNENVFKSGLSKKSNMLYNFSCDEKIDFNTMTCALIQLSSGSCQPLLFGSGKNQKISDSEIKLASSISVLDKPISVVEVEKTLEQNQIYLENQNEIEKQIDDELACDSSCQEKCSSCKYREAFFGNEEKAPIRKQLFIDDIKDQLENIFDKYPQEEFLCEIFPNSKWAKIDYENDGEYYIVGVIYDNENIKYVCYGVPGIYSENAPEELRGFSKFLPLNEDEPHGYGYWISYQDAESGENVAIEVI